MVRQFLMGVVILSAMAGPTWAMDRYYCAVDDAQLKLSIETGFKEQPGWPISHIAGIVIFKPGTGRSLEGKMRLGIADVVQYWRDGESFRLHTLTKTGEGDEATDVELQLVSHRDGGDINRFRGTYTVVVKDASNDEPKASLQQKGDITCSRF